MQLRQLILGWLLWFFIVIAVFMIDYSVGGLPFLAHLSVLVATVFIHLIFMIENIRREYKPLLLVLFAAIQLGISVLVYSMMYLHMACSIRSGCL